MKTEIERKFFVRQMPDISHIKPLFYERYILKYEDGEEERISKIDGKYIYQKKKEVSALGRRREKKEMSLEEFNKLKQTAKKAIFRERYDLSEHPKVSIQIYRGEHEGLIRAEVEFDSEEEATNFKPFDWMGIEMTNLPIARDAKLLNLTKEEFKSHLAQRKS